MTTLFALRRGVPTLARASSSNAQPCAASARYLSSGSSSDPLGDILGSMAGKSDSSDSPPRSPSSQSASPPRGGNRIAAAPITPLRQRSGSHNQWSTAEDDPYIEAAAQAFGIDLPSRRSSFVPYRSGRQQKQQPVMPDTVLYKLYVLARSKSCIMTLVDEGYNQRGGVSAGQVGFKNSAEGSYEAGYQCAVKVLSMLRSEIERRRGEVEVCVELMLNGFGQGRGALLKALSMAEGDGIRDAVVRVTDKTPIRVGGVRLQKKRRL